MVCCYKIRRRQCLAPEAETRPMQQGLILFLQNFLQNFVILMRNNVRNNGVAPLCPR